MDLRFEKTHPHGDGCPDFANALKWGHIVIIEGEPDIPSKLREVPKPRNIVLTEEDDLRHFTLSTVIK